jgi:hypothetical protein
VTTPEEHDRLAHLAACEAVALSMIPAPSVQPVIPVHEDEVMARHLGRPLNPGGFSVAGEAVA